MPLGLMGWTQPFGLSPIRYWVESDPEPLSLSLPCSARSPPGDASPPSPPSAPSAAGQLRRRFSPARLRPVLLLQFPAATKPPSSHTHAPVPTSAEP